MTVDLIVELCYTDTDRNLFSTALEVMRNDYFTVALNGRKKKKKIYSTNTKSLNMNTKGGMTGVNFNGRVVMV